MEVSKNGLKNIEKSTLEKIYIQHQTVQAFEAVCDFILN
jgi:hypothetical protein